MAETKKSGPLGPTLEDPGGSLRMSDDAPQYSGIGAPCKGRRGACANPLCSARRTAARDTPP
ncbi:hypothetical protein C882_3174 [Caenispirillum salinarum AK4]|uniref:Uncharacterized protein n=1 Tax=Caenispirillum salinarum AK4 TaxID=1238182 RepID=K9H1L0_9PROT|nr:hypothetical protein C882_3174 [Caenispirillum salinarum AK4]